MSNDDLINLVYVSRAVKLLTEDDHMTLLRQARIQNSKEDITGMLLYKDMSFMQLIEGPVAVVKSLFEKIENDDRHTRIELLLEETIVKRRFSDWSMGFANLKNATLSQERGYSDFLENDNDLLQLIDKPNLAIKLLLCFRSNS